MTFPTPFQGSAQPGQKRMDVTGSVVSTSPAVVNLPMTEQGIWEGVIGGWFAGPTNRFLLPVQIHWYQWEGVGSFLRAAIALGPATVIGNVSAVTVAAPTNAGLVAVTITSSAGNSEVHAGMNLRLVSSTADQFAI